MTQLSALIVGCGNIAGRFDFARKGPDEAPVTHAGAYVRDGRFRLAACVESDEARRLAFMKTWGIPRGFPSIEELQAAPERFDVVSICSPSERHGRDLDAALGLRPKLIFCEKPVTTSAPETENVVRACAAADIKLAVNYTRRWDPAVSELRADIGKHRWGPLRSVVGHYNKGLLNNGSHMIDLLLMLLGPLKVVHVGRSTIDHSAADPTVPVWLEAAGELPVHIACGHGADYSLFELQFVFSTTVISMEEGGMFWRERAVVDSPSFPGYRAPGDGIRRAGGYLQAMLRSVDNIFGAIRYGNPLASTGESALSVQRLCEQITS